MKPTHPEELSGRSPWFIPSLLLVLTIGTALRFFKLGEWGFWVDEGMTYLRATSGNLSDQGPMYSTAPLNFLVTRAVISLTEPSSFWLRAFPAVCGVLGVAAVAWAGTRFYDRRTGIVAALLLAIHPWHLDWSQNARHFSPVFLFAVLALIAVHAFIQVGGWRWLVLAAGAMGAGLLTHSSMTFVIAALALACVLTIALRNPPAWPAPRGRLLALGGLFALVAAAYAPIAFSVSGYLGEHKTAWNPPSNVAASILYYAGPWELAFATAWGAAGMTLRRPSATFLVCLLVLPVAGSVFAASRTISSGAYALPILAPVVLLVASGSVALWDMGGRAKIAGAALTAAVLASLTVRSALYFTVEQGNRPPWKEAAAWLNPRVAEGDEIYATDGIAAGLHLGAPEKVRWLDAWRRPQAGTVQWILILSGSAPPRSASYLVANCQTVAVFPRNTGPKRRDVVVYRCGEQPRSVTSRD